jgi:hypothetical protein
MNGRSPAANPYSYLADVLAEIVNGHPQQPDQRLPPWRTRQQSRQRRGLRAMLRRKRLIDRA